MLRLRQHWSFNSWSHFVHLPLWLMLLPGRPLLTYFVEFYCFHPWCPKAMPSTLNYGWGNIFIYLFNPVDPLHFMYTYWFNSLSLFSSRNFYLIPSSSCLDVANLALYLLLIVPPCMKVTNI